MKHSTKTLVLAFVAFVITAMPCMAQEVEPPFTWAGEGSASFISQDGIQEIDFDFELSIDEQGRFKGQTSSDEGSSQIKHVFYSEKKEHGFPGFFSRKIVIVFMLNEYGDNPLLCVLNGRILVDKFLYGEELLTMYEEDSDIARALGVGNNEATLIEADEDELPSNLKSAMNKCLPFGVVKIEGDFKEQEKSDTAQSQDVTIDLFDCKDLQGWEFYFKEAGTDEKNVWKVQDGEIVCSGNPVGFMRTAKEYSDYKLELEWKWVDKPGNSGVLLHMTDEEKIWPLCMEAQLMHTRAGDLIGMGCNFNENKAGKDSFIKYTPRMKDSNEKEPGGWNKYEIVCKQDTIEVTINGQLQNKATGVAIQNGYIGLQSEGVPIMFRNIKLTPLR